MKDNTVTTVGLRVLLIRKDFKLDKQEKEPA